MQKTNRTAGCLLLESDVHPDEEMLGRRSWQGAMEEAVQLCSSESSRDWQLGRSGAHGSIQPAWEQSRETLTHRREAGGSEAQMPSCKLVLHMNAFLPTTSEQLT